MWLGRLVDGMYYEVFALLILAGLNFKKKFFYRELRVIYADLQTQFAKIRVIRGQGFSLSH